ncbi:MAG: carboxypeptidase-like regulatory domain-containing protein [Planctomycetaceae bacterium]|nr:carboxypeptidase-like regulatory domain-containing protein [Planctomycetaceae bacterium]
MKWTVTNVVILLAFFVVSGCGKPKIEGLVPVRGTIVYNGEPLADAVIGLTPKVFGSGARIGAGTTNTEGKFELRTIGERGVLPGEYTVVVVKNEMLPGKPSAQTPRVDPKTGREIPVHSLPPEIKSLIPKRYNDPNTSGLSVVVEKNGLADWRVELVD